MYLVEMCFDNVNSITVFFVGEKQGDSWREEIV